MRHFLKPKSDVLAWLISRDSRPRVLPIQPKSDEFGLIVAHLLAGNVIAEVLTTEKAVTAAVGSGVPMGRLYFHIPRKDILAEIPQLTAAEFS